MAFSMKKLVLISILVLMALNITACTNTKTGNKDKSQDTAHSANDIRPAAPDTAISNVTETTGEDGTTAPAAETSGFALKVRD
jgi:predicted small secreted protein